jgi:cytochrome c-type biogenesis protein CcmH
MIDPYLRPRRFFAPSELKTLSWISWRAAAIVAFILLSAAPAFAVEPDEMLKDPKLEARAEHLGQQLRCPVCKTESIEESDADFTKDLRRVVRERVSAGDTDQQVLDFMHARYGDFILLQPPFKPYTLALWLAPPIILLLGAALAYRRARIHMAAEPDVLSPDEQKALEALK